MSDTPPLEPSSCALQTALQAEREETARLRHALEAAERQRELLQQVIDHIPGTVGFIDTRLVVQVANTAATRAYSRPLAEVLGRPLTEILPESVYSRTLPLMKQVLATGVPWREAAVALPQPDGSLQYRDVMVEPLRDKTGAVTGFVTLSFDVSARKHAELALEEANAQLELQKALSATMINAFPGAIAYCGPDMVHRAANDAAAQRYGLPDASALLGRQAKDFHPAAQAHVEPHARRVMATGEPHLSYGDRLEIETPEGIDVRYRDFLIVPVPEAQGGGFVVVSLIATERVRLELLVKAQLEELQRADRYKDEFLSVISHELRTPLNFITGFASSLLDGLFGPITEKQEGAVSRILAGSDRMLALVNDLLEVAKLSSGQLDLARTPTCYPALVSEVVSTMQPLIDAKEQTIVVEVPSELEAMLDPQRTGQVLLNLLSNAIKFTPEGGRVTVRAAVRDGRLVTEVEDTGCGIAPENHDRLFRRFSQLDMSATRAHGGTGLGLSIAKALVEAHGGQVGVESRPGHGSSFWFELPLPPAEPQ